MQPDPVRELVAFAVEKIRDGEVPATHRARLLRAAAQVVRDEADAAEFAQLANVLDEAARRERQLCLRFLGTVAPFADGKEPR